MEAYANSKGNRLLIIPKILPSSYENFAGKSHQTKGNKEYVWQLSTLVTINTTKLASDMYRCFTYTKNQVGINLALRVQ